MRRVVVLAGLALALAGALIWFAPRAPRVALLTGDPLGGPGCYTNSAQGPLVIDPTYGTAIIDSDVHATAPMPVMWRLGFTARRVDGEIVVFNQAGFEVARTGRSYRIAGGYVGPESNAPVSAFFACDFVIPQ